MKKNRLAVLLLLFLAPIYLPLLSSSPVVAAGEEKIYHIDMQKLGTPKPKTEKEKLVWELFRDFKKLSKSLITLEEARKKLIADLKNVYGGTNPISGGFALATDDLTQKLILNTAKRDSARERLQQIQVSWKSNKLHLSVGKLTLEPLMAVRPINYSKAPAELPKLAEKMSRLEYLLRSFHNSGTDRQKPSVTRTKKPKRAKPVPDTKDPPAASKAAPKPAAPPQKATVPVVQQTSSPKPVTKQKPAGTSEIKGWVQDSNGKTELVHTKDSAGKTIKIIETDYDPHGKVKGGREYNPLDDTGMGFKGEEKNAAEAAKLVEQYQKQGGASLYPDKTSGNVGGGETTVEQSESYTSGSIGTTPDKSKKHKQPKSDEPDADAEDYSQKDKSLDDSKIKKKKAVKTKPKTKKTKKTGYRKKSGKHRLIIEKIK